MVVFGAGLMLLTACESKETKKSARPVAQAMAPAASALPQQKPSTPAPSGPAATATPATQPKQPESQTTAPQQNASADPVPAIITEAEKAYQAGQEDLKAGKMDAAKEDFNRALEILGQRPAEVRADERIQAEFDKITEEISKLEQATTKEP